MEKNKSNKEKTAPKVIAGVKTPTALNPHLRNILSKNKKQQLGAVDYFKAIRKGDKMALAQAITIIESTRPADQKIAETIIERCLPFANQSIRIGITGAPGVGKSTFIESFGSYLTTKHKKVAVLAVDPSSQISGGSILGDKTRMEELASNPAVFVRPSPAKSSLGGVARKTRETMILCEAGGYDTLLIETVGVGQSEILVHSMVDFFLLLLLPGAGDELQGIKRGIVEMADLIVINKADGDRVKLAKRTRIDYKNALHLFPPKESQWIANTVTCSALEKEGVDKINQQIEKYIRQVKENHYFEQNRQKQAKYWLLSSINQGLQAAFYENETIKEGLKTIETAVLNNEISPFQGAEKLLTLFKKS